MPNRVGQKFGNYQLISLLGRGGFAEVYLGEHFYLKRHAAIKILDAPLTSEDLQEFLKEAQTIAHLKHPHIVSVLDFGIDSAENAPYLVMDYAPNGNLRQRHPKGSILPLPTVISYVKQIADALNYAHERKLIHCDIKPENMLLDDRNNLLLSDFGIAATAHSTASLKTQAYAGTVHYSAPEQIQGKPRIVSDQYALAVVVYEWLTGRGLFTGSQHIAIAMQHLTATPESLRARVPTISPEVEEIVLTALSKEPEKRFKNIQAFAIALEQAGKAKVMAIGEKLLTYPLAGAVAIAWSPDNARIISIHENPSISYRTSSLHVWDAETGHQIFARDCEYYGRNVAYSPDGMRIAMPLVNAEAAIWDASDGSLIATCYLRGYYGSNVVWSPDGKYLASLNCVGLLSICDAATGKCVWPESYDRKSEGIIADPIGSSGLAWSPDGKYIAYGYDALFVRSVPSLSVSFDFNLKQNSLIWDVAWSPDGKCIAGVVFEWPENRVVIHIWDLQSGQCILNGRIHSYPTRISWSPDSTKIVLPEGGEVTICDVKTGENVFVYRKNVEIVRCAAWSPDGTRIASADANTVQIWKAP